MPACHKLNKISNIFWFSVFSLLLSACETEQSFDAPEAYGPLRLIGTPVSTLYSGTRFDVEFGVSGGQAPYRYRYLKEQPEGFGFDTLQAENGLEFNILEGGGAKSSFRLQGAVLAADDSDSSSTTKSAYYIEVTDGINTIVEEFVYNLLTPTLAYPQASSLGERADNLGIFDSALNNLANGREAFYCNNIKESAYPFVSEIDGRPVRTTAIGINLQRGLLESFSISYRITSDYEESDLETGSGNLGVARPDVDFVASEGRLIFEPGARFCMITVQVFDDTVVEGEEGFKIELFDGVGAVVDISAIEESFFEITDNEGSIAVEPVVGVINVSESANVPLKLSISGAETYLNFGVDERLTTAEPSSFELVPQTGIAVFPEGERDSSMGVRVVAPTADKLGPDPEVVLFSAADYIDDEDASVFTVNEWPFGGLPENELVTLADNEVRVVAIAGDIDGRVYVLKHAVDSLGFSYGVVSAMYRDGSRYRLTDASNDILIRKPGVNISPKDLIFAEAEDAVLTVVSEVDAAFNGDHKGLVDILVTGYSFDDAGLTSLKFDAQYGTESNDLVDGVSLNNVTLYIYGSTEGLQFDGEGGSQINRGGSDGFVYSLRTIDGAKQWATFVGNEEPNSVLALAAGRLEIYPLISNDIDGRRAFLRLLDQDGDIDSDVEDFSLLPISPHYFRSSLANPVGDTFTILSDGSSSPFSGEASASRTRDVFVSLSDATLEGRSSLVISTNGTEIAASQSYLVDKELLGVFGTTTGEFDNNISVGEEDAFLAVISTEDGVRLRTITQFGTPGNDQAIDSISVGESKFLVLWQEDFTSGDSSPRYRISAFAFDGRKLSPDF